LSGKDAAPLPVPGTGQITPATGIQIISLLFIRFMDTTYSRAVTTRIQTRLNTNTDGNVANVIPRQILTTGVRGRTTFAKTWSPAGSTDKGKNVPENNNIGVMNRKEG